MPAAKDVFGTKVNLLSQGVTQNFTAKNSLTLQGTAMTQVAILARLAAITGRDTASTNAKAAWTAALAAKTAAMPADEKFVAELITVIKSTFGAGSPVLASFGIAAPKAKAALTTIQKAISTALSKNTRVARGTMSAKERQSITTTGKPGVVVVGPDGSPLLTVSPVAPGSSAAPTVTVGAGSAPAANSASGSTAGAAPATVAPAGSTSNS
jgi:hypothetical protein